MPQRAWSGLKGAASFATLLCWIIVRAHAQEAEASADFDYDTVNALAYEDPAAARAQAQAFLDLDPEDPAERANALDVIGVSHHFEGDHQSAIDALQHALIAANAGGDEAQIAGIHLNYGEALAKNGDYAEAIANLRLAAAGARKIDDAHIWLASLTNTFGLLFEAGNFEAALPYAEDAAAIAAEGDLPFTQFVTSINVAIVNARLGNTQKADEALAAAKKIYDYESDGVYTRLQTAYSEAFINYQAGRTEDAGAHARTCLSLAAEINATTLDFDCRKILTDIALQTDDIESAANQLASMEDYIESGPAASALNEEVYARQMSALAAITGDTAIEAKFAKRRFEAAKIMADRQMQISMALAASEFSSEGKDLRLSLEEARSAAAQAEAAQARTTTIAASIGLTLSLLVIFMLIRNLRLNRRVAEELEYNLQQRNLYARDLRHRARNNLQTIISLLNLHRKSYTDSQNSDQKLADDLTARVRAMTILENQLYEDQGKMSEQVNMDEFLSELASSVAKTAGAEDRLTEVSIEPVVLEPEIAAPIGLIVSELLLNAFKYALGATVKVGLSLSKAGDKVLMTVADNGPGFDPDTIERKRQSSGGLGLQIVEDLTAQVGGTLELDRSGGGAVWRFVGPVQTES
ncbi:MAG: ATP-binding protein [Pseudomonadota bacterium]